MTFEKWLSEIIESKSINLSDAAIKSGVSYRAVYNSLRGTGRELRSSELIAICKYVGINPMNFVGGDADAEGSFEHRTKNGLQTV
ncbi:MAG: hypothetical protein HDQ95_07450 [Roseburia sp.]|nr:hypothetical protein [Roseburia sp.]